MYFYDKNVNSHIKMLSKPVTEQFLILRGVVPIDKVVWFFIKKLFCMMLQSKYQIKKLIKF